jgi:AcrR family transcriptional regulator
MPKLTKTDRQTRILDAAENAFADCGFDGASLRQIVSEAKVNLATVYYYFGSKDGLMEAVLKRRFGPLRQENMDLLRQYEREAKGRRLTVEKILEAMLLPPLRLASAPATRRQAVTRLIGRIVTEPNPRIQEVLRGQHAHVRAAFLQALHLSLPHIPPADLQWRLEFVWGALAFMLCNPGKFERQSGRSHDPRETRKVLLEMVAFFAPGFRAPVRNSD